jgi:hypothetical protein
VDGIGNPPSRRGITGTTPLAQAQRTEHGVFSGERRFAPGRRRTRGSGQGLTAPIRPFFVSLVAPHRCIERLTGKPAAVVRAAPAATGHAPPATIDLAAHHASDLGLHPSPPVYRQIEIEEVGPKSRGGRPSDSHRCLTASRPGVSPRRPEKALTCGNGRRAG